MRTTRNCTATIAIMATTWLPSLRAETISGKVVDQSGAAAQGVMVSAFDEERRQWTSVFSQADGSFAIDSLRDADYTVRVRLMGKMDEWLDDVEAGEKIEIQMQPATGLDLEDQRPASDAFGMLKFANQRDKQNFKMMCSYCHQIGTIGFRTPEEPVDWETMLRKMDGFGGLYPHTQRTIVKQLMDTYKDEAIDKWPTFVPPPAPTGTAALAKITAWELDEHLEGTFHDLEIGSDGLVYAVNIKHKRLITLDPETGQQTTYLFPQRTWGPHSIEPDNEGNMWITMCASGHMVKFDITTKEFTVTSSAEAPRERGSYPHTLRVNPKDPDGLVWYTDAGENTCYSLHPSTLFVKKYNLLSANQAVAAGKGESRGITPYGLDYSPVDGMIWFSKLNGNRIGRIDPNAPDGNIKEWNPPFRGPRRLHVAPDGMVWVPGFGSGVFGKFDPNTEKWTVYDLPDAENQIPYALNIDPKGFVWICGTHNDTLNRFDPRTEKLVEFRLPMRVSYTREIEFDAEGNVWTSTSGPPRHMERGVGQIIKLELPDEDAGGGIKLVGKTYDGQHDVGDRLADVFKNSPNGKLLARIDQNELPPGYRGETHQQYVDKRIAGMTEAQRGRLGALWHERQRIDPDLENAGASFIRILEYVANGESENTAKMRAKPKTTNNTNLPGVKGVSGLVRFDGPRPQRKRIHMHDGKGGPSDCQELHEHGLLDENLLVDDNDGLANVFVYVKKGLERKNYPVPDKPAILNQVDCMFQPRVQGVMIGQEIVMKNGDPLLHNVRANSFRNRPFNVAQPANSPDRSKVFTRKEKGITIQCDLHPWMKAYYHVMDHPYFAVTDEAGRFQIEGLPAGEYTFAAWHEELGEQDVEITVASNGSARVDFEFKTKKSNVVQPKESDARSGAMKHSHGTDPIRSFVKKWTVEDMSADANDLAARSTQHGREVFEAAGCIKCHVVSGKGAKYGPDLTDVAKRHKGEKLLQQVLKPSTEIHKEFETHMFLLDEGQVVTGLIIKEGDNAIHVLPNPLKPEEIAIVDKSSIDQRRKSDVSTMPEGLLDTFKRDEILDLLAFVQAGGK